MISQQEVKNFIWKTLDALCRTEDCTSECLTIVAAAATSHLWECVFSHQTTDAESEKRAERGSRPPDKWSRVIPFRETGTERWVDRSDSRYSQELCCLCAQSKVIPSHSMFRWTLLDVPDPFSSFNSSSPQTTSTSRPMTGIRSVPCVTSLKGKKSDHLTEPLPHTIDTGEGTLTIGTKSKKDIIDSQSRGSRNVVTYYPLSYTCEHFKKTKLSRVRVKNKTWDARGRDYTSYIIRKTWSPQITKFWTWNKTTSRPGHKNVLIVQDDFTNWTQSFPMKTKETSETMYLQRCLSPSQKSKIIHTHTIPKSLQEHLKLYKWNHDRSTPHRSQTTEWSKELSAESKKETAIATMQSGLPEEWKETTLWNTN